MIAAAPAVSQVNLANGLTACYPLNGNANDAYGTTNGVLSLVTPTVDRFNTPGAAIHLNGTTGSYVEFPDVPALKPQNELSFSIWVKPEIPDAYILFTKNSLPSNFEAYNLCMTSQQVFMTLKSSPQGYNIYTDNTTVTPNTWYHLVTTISSNAVCLYINGTLAGSVAATFTGFDYVSGKKVYFGSTQESTYDNPFKGSMDNARFYNRVLTPQEVSALYSTDPVCKVVNAASVLPVAHQPEFACFPSPAHDKLVIETGDNAGGPLAIQVADALGRVVINCSPRADEDKIFIDVSEIPAGVYLVTLQSGNAKQTRRIVID